MKYLFVFNDAPYGNQRSHNGLRVAAALSRKAKIRVFLLGDGVLCGMAGPMQITTHRRCCGRSRRPEQRSRPAALAWRHAVFPQNC